MAEELGKDFGDHFWIFDGDGKVLLTNGLPVHPDELVDLIDEVYYKKNKDRKNFRTEKTVMLKKDSLCCMS